MPEKKSYAPRSFGGVFKNFILGILIVLLFLFIASKHSFHLDFKEKKTPLVTTLFSAKNIELYTEEKNSLTVYISSQNLNFLYEKNEKKSLHFEGNTKAKWEEKNSSYKIHSEKMNIVWDLTGKDSNLQVKTFSQAEFIGDVKIFSESSLLKTKKAIFLPKENLFTSSLPSRFISEYGYLESQNGFNWDIGKKIFLINKGFDGISYEKK